MLRFDNENMVGYTHMNLAENSFLHKVLRIALIFTPFIFTLLYVPGFLYPAVFPRAIFLYSVISVILIIWLIYVFRYEKLILPKNWLTAAILIYILTLFISGITGGHFEHSFFGDYSRTSGIIIFIYIAAWYLASASVFRPKDWVNTFRALLFSGVVLAVISLLGINGLAQSAFNFLDQGGSLFSNNTFSGIYYVFAFFFGVILFAKESSWRWQVGYAVAMFIILVNPDILNFQLWQDPSMIKEVFKNPVLASGTARASSAVMGIGIVLTLILYVIHRIRVSIVVKGVIFLLIFVSLLSVSVPFIWSVAAQKGFGYDLLTSQSDYQRPMLWGYGMQAFKERPLLGYGPNNFEYALQDTLTSDIFFLKGGNWADKAHNSLIDSLVETGIVGTLVMLFIFLTASWYGFKRYRSTQDFSIPVTILILVLHFTQTQTAFNTSTSLLMIFILLAYISSEYSRNILFTPSRRAREIALWLGSGVIIVMLIVGSILPALYNRNVAKALGSRSIEKRLQVYQSLHSLYGYPPEVLRKITEIYTGALVRNFDALKNNQKAREEIPIELGAILDLYEKHYDQYADNLKYIINYVRTIHVARLFDVDRLDRADELISRAKEISTSVPQVFWLSALQAKYIGNEALALEEIGHAIIMAEDGRAKFESFGQLDHFYYATSFKIRGFIEDTSDSKKKQYFQIGGI